MSWSTDLTIPKQLMPLTLWVHPNRQLLASMFLPVQGLSSLRAEDPVDVFNDGAPFLTLKLTEANIISFYHKRWILYATYRPASLPLPLGGDLSPCQLYLRNATLLTGYLCEALPPHTARLSDMLNHSHGQFMQLYTGESDVYLVNKDAIVQAGPLSPHRLQEPPWANMTLEGGPSR
jgi:hypothetical protein